MIPAGLACVLVSAGIAFPPLQRERERERLATAEQLITDSYSSVRGRYVNLVGLQPSFPSHCPCSSVISNGAQGNVNCWPAQSPVLSKVLLVLHLGYSLVFEYSGSHQLCLQYTNSLLSYSVWMITSEKSLPLCRSRFRVKTA